MPNTVPQVTNRCWGQTESITINSPEQFLQQITNMIHRQNHGCASDFDVACVRTSELQDESRSEFGVTDPTPVLYDGVRLIFDDWSAVARL